MRIMFMGTPDFASSILEKLIKEKYNIISVVTQPDKQRGRGKKVSFSHVKEVAVKHDIPVYQPKRLRDQESIDFIKELNPDLIIVAAFGQILPKEILEAPRHGCINVHASLLPKYRGATPIQYAIIDGEKETGITIMYMDQGLDTGDIIRKQTIPIGEKETGGSLFDKLAVLSGQVLIKSLEDIKAGKIERIAQDDSKASHVKMLNKKMGDIDFSKSAVEIERLIRGLNPWPSAYTELNGEMIKIWDSDYVEMPMEIKKKNLSPGTLMGMDEGKIKVITGDGLLQVNELQLAGRKRMAAEEFLRGYSREDIKKFGN